MTAQEFVNAVEAVVFAVGEPVSVSRLAEVFGKTESEIGKAVDKLEEKYNNTKSGIRLVRINDGVQLASAVECADYVKIALDLRRKTPLSPAGFEVLAVIAYNQPVTRAFVEQVRGVDCSGVIATLCEKELIEEKGRLELPGRPLLYGTTDNFLRCFSLKSLADLPELPPRDEPAPETDANVDGEDGEAGSESSAGNAATPAADDPSPESGAPDSEV